jgi:hypothetical protein
MAATLSLNDVDCSAQHLWANCGHLVSMVWVNYQVERPRFVATRNLTVRNEVVVVFLYAEQTSKPWAAALAQVKPHVIGKRSLSICALYGFQ